jgi:predicted HD phosphohydrolase
VDKVSFAYMEHGTKEDYELIGREDARGAENLPDRVLRHFQTLAEEQGPYKITRFEHCLQSATRAYRAGEDEEMIVAALLHDIGDVIAPFNHSDFAAAMLKPFVSERTHWIVKYHGLFQTYYYNHLIGGDRNVREQFKAHKWYQDTVDFCHNYDQNCFDPDYDNLPLEFFEPMVQRLFSRPSKFHLDVPKTMEQAREFA